MTYDFNKARGIMLGMACGDALGAQVEFRPRGLFPRQTEMTGGGPHRLEPGQWTDDTAMALALAEHLTRPGRKMADEESDLMNRWVSWWRSGEYSCTGDCFDIGGRTMAALSCWSRTGKTISPASTRVFPDGNGAVMRVAPVAIFYMGREEFAVREAWRQALYTHGRLAAAMAEIVTLAICELALGHSVESVVDRAFGRGESWGMRDVRNLRRSEIESGGHCLDTTEASLWCLLRTSSFEEAVVRAVDLGEDADTTGAVTGALAGARWGEGGIPERWLRMLAQREHLGQTAERLAPKSGVAK